MRFFQSFLWQTAAFMQKKSDQTMEKNQSYEFFLETYIS